MDIIIYYIAGKFAVYYAYETIILRSVCFGACVCNGMFAGTSQGNFMSDEILNNVSDVCTETCKWEYNKPVKPVLLRNFCTHL